MGIIPYKAAFPVNDVLHKKGGVVRRNPSGYIKKRGLIYPLEGIYVVQKSLKYDEDWVQDFKSGFQETINLPLGATYGDHPWAAFYAPDGAKIRFCAKIAYTRLQVYDDITNLGGGNYQIRSNQESIRFWAAAKTWMAYSDGTLEAPFYSCGNCMNYRDSSNRLNKIIGMHYYMYDISPKGLRYGYNYKPTRLNVYGEGINEFPELDILNIYSGPPEKNLLNLDITFNVPSPIPYFEKFLALPSDFATSDEADRTLWKNGRILPVVELGIDFNILPPDAYSNNYSPFLPDTFYKSQDTIYWVYEIQTFINDIPVNEYGRVIDSGMAPPWDKELIDFIDGRFYRNFEGSNTNQYPFPLMRNHKERKVIPEEFKEAPWERYPQL